MSKRYWDVETIPDAVKDWIDEEVKAAVMLSFKDKTSSWIGFDRDKYKNAFYIISVGTEDPINIDGITDRFHSLTGLLEELEEWISENKDEESVRNLKALANDILDLAKKYE